MPSDERSYSTVEAKSGAASRYITCLPQNLWRAADGTVIQLCPLDIYNCCYGNLWRHRGRKQKWRLGHDERCRNMPTLSPHADPWSGGAFPPALAFPHIKSMDKLHLHQNPWFYVAIRGLQGHSRVDSSPHCSRMRFYGCQFHVKINLNLNEYFFPDYLTIVHITHRLTLMRPMPRFIPTRWEFISFSFFYISEWSRGIF